jgi:hypothetical protein
MRFFRNADSSPLGEREVANDRLNAIVGRSQAELELYSKTEETEEPERVYRRFWSPAELAEASRRA